MEIELKLEVDPADAERLAQSRFLDGARSEDLVSTYFDTPTHQLHEAGFSLRVRHAGDRRIQTVKADGPAAAGLFVRAEWEHDIDGDAPVLDSPGQPLRQHFRDKVLAQVGPVFRTRVTRLTTISKDRDTGIEVILDRGNVVAAHRTSSICEVELELRKGAQATLFDLARRLDDEVPVRLGVLSKSERGYRLADGSGGRATRSEPVLLAPDMTAAAAFQVIAAAAIRQFRLNEMLLAATDDPGALHQARVGLRRLRSALSLFKPMLADAGFARLRAELRWLGGVLGDARNIDVLVAGAVHESWLAQLRQHQQQAYRLVAEALASKRVRLLMLDLMEWLSLGDWLAAPDRAKLRERPVHEAASDLLDRCRRRVKRRGSELVELDDTDRHELRIEVKKLRYAAEFFASLYTGRKAVRRTKRFGKALVDLQDRLGELNDLATMPAVIDRLGIVDAATCDARDADANKAEVLAKAEIAFDDLIDARRFWR